MRHLPARLLIFGIIVVLLGVTQRLASAAAPDAWQVISAYQPDTIQGGNASQNWSPKSGTLTGNVVLNGGTRYTHVGVQNLAWSQQNINWMRNTQWPNDGDPAVTFHAQSWAGGCTSWEARGDYFIGGTLPNLRIEKLSRNGCTDYEIRVYSDEDNLIANGQYWTQVKYWDKILRSQAKIVVDTYWVTLLGGQGNYHQHYCVPNNQDLAKDRTNC